MATYGLQTVKANGTTVVFENSSKSGVFARTFVLVPENATLVNGVYRKEFPEYAGRTIRVLQLKTGNAIWTAGTTGNGLNVITFEIVNPYSSFTHPKFTVGNTVLYIFVK